MITYVYIYIYICLSICLSVCLSIYQSINLSIYQSIHLYLSIVEQVQQPHTYKQRVPMAHVLRYFCPMLSSTRRWFPGDWIEVPCLKQLPAQEKINHVFDHKALSFGFSFVTCTKATDWDVWGVVIACRGARSAAFPLRVPAPTKQGTSTAIASRAKNGSSTRRDMLGDASGLRAEAKRCGDEGG